MQDLRLAVRALRATPIVTAVAVLSLALAIGANTAIFSLVDSLLLRTLPVKDPVRLVLVTEGVMTRARAWSYPVWEQIRQRRELFERSAAWSFTRFNLTSSGETEFVDGLWASGCFETLGVPALLGRTFSTPTIDAAAARMVPWRWTATASAAALRRAADAAAADAAGWCGVHDCGRHARFSVRRLAAPSMAVPSETKLWSVAATRSTRAARRSTVMARLGPEHRWTPPRRHCAERTRSAKPPWRNRAARKQTGRRSH